MAAATRAKIHRGSAATLTKLARALRRGELVAVPTETVYGLAADALSERACRAIFRAKGRPTNDPLIVHIHDLAQWDTLAHVSADALLLAGAFWPGPLTIVLPKRADVPDIVTSGLPSVAVRMPAHPLFRRLLKACGRPLAAPSANPFGYISPTKAEHVLESLGTRIRHILDGGPCAIGLESTIIDLRDPAKPLLLRPGAIERKALEAVLGRRVSLPAKKRRVTARTAALAPGMLSKHYSPRKPLQLQRRLTRRRLESLPTTEAALVMQRPDWLKGAELPHNIFVLSDDPSRGREGLLESAARNLFSELRRLDRGPWLRLHAELAPGSSALALAINDRLSRAAAK